MLVALLFVALPLVELPAVVFWLLFTLPLLDVCWLLVVRLNSLLLLTVVVTSFVALTVLVEPVPVLLILIFSGPNTPLTSLDMNVVDGPDGVIGVVGVVVEVGVVAGVNLPAEATILPAIAVVVAVGTPHILDTSLGVKAAI